MESVRFPANVTPHLSMIDVNLNEASACAPIERLHGRNILEGR
jgi:hypothetical protein